jgi:hypothetical protein
LEELSLLALGTLTKPVDAIRPRPGSDGSVTNVNIGEEVKKPENIQQPEHYHYYDHRIQNRLNRIRHRDVGIHQPQEDSDNNQGYNDLN